MLRLQQNRFCHQSRGQVKGHAQRGVGVAVACQQQHRLAVFDERGHCLCHADVARNLHPGHGANLAFRQQAAVAEANRLLLCLEGRAG